MGANVRDELATRLVKPDDGILLLRRFLQPALATRISTRVRLSLPAPLASKRLIEKSRNTENLELFRCPTVAREETLEVPTRPRVD
jgi:hypothetical protein